MAVFLNHATQQIHADLKVNETVPREFLKNLAASLINANGTVKSGYLRVSGDGPWSAGHMGSGATNATNILLVRVKAAYGRDAESAMQNYLKSTSAKNGSAGKVGTQSFVALIKQMEANSPENSSNTQDDTTKKILAARVGHHRLITEGVVPIRVQHPNTNDVQGLLKKDETPLIKTAPESANKLKDVAIIKSAETSSKLVTDPRYADLFKNFEAVISKASIQSKAAMPVEVPLEVAAPVIAEAKVEIPSESAAGDAELHQDEVHDNDVPDLVQLPASMKATEALNKSHRFSITHDIEPFKAKQYNLLDSGPYRELGEVINARLEEMGLQAPRGMSKIDLNGEPVYCYFDATGKARAILPKGTRENNETIHIKTLDREFTERELEIYQEEYLGLEYKFQGKDTKMLKLAAFEKNITDGKILSTFKKTLGAKNDNDPRIKVALSEFLDPLSKGERVAVQFSIGKDAWIGELSVIPGVDISKIRPNEFYKSVSIRLAPLDAPINQAVLTTKELNEFAPRGEWSKNSRVQLAYEYDKLRTTIDNTYIKRNYHVSDSHLDYFEFLISQEANSPGIIHRLLVGAATPDKSKTISPMGPSKTLGSIYVKDERLDDLKAAGITSVNDIFAFSNGGFDKPEAKADHYLIDPNAEKFEIKMIDFYDGRTNNLAVKKRVYEKSVNDLILYLTFAMKINKWDQSELTGARKALIDAIKEHANMRFAELS